MFQASVVQRYCCCTSALFLNGLSSKPGMSCKVVHVSRNPAAVTLSVLSSKQSSNRTFSSYMSSVTDALPSTVAFDLSSFAVQLVSPCDRVVSSTVPSHILWPESCLVWWVRPTSSPHLVHNTRSSAASHGHDVATWQHACVVVVLVDDVCDKRVADQRSVASAQRTCDVGCEDVRTPHASGHWTNHREMVRVVSCAR